MLDTITKKRIDDCRDILVGKLPDPKAQIEQITIALIYKFMDDMDKEAIELGGKAKFFSNYKIPNPEFPNDRKKDIVVPFEQYSWNNLFNAKVTATEMLRLYQEAITGMDKNPNIPPLFRDIFKNAFLPYRDPETLKLFLKTIGEFEYTHSEKLGDAFEYLLSVMGSQGDAGQFRTPRHIIDFVVKLVNPGKNESIMDPACGTAGFLISAFKHIKEKSPKGLTPEERKKMMRNFVGYDISPDMVRLSLVNLYLHGFSDPHIWEYDTLSSEERWDETFDVVLANPPFMSPKGGIRPHKKFSIASNRSEVLFVDYIAEHLNPKGRAGIIVPEGIIFQSGTAYKELRKILVENYLYAVVSLPAGVFNPYSGVKTSILLMDKQLAKQQQNILFVKIENDGYSLGAQRNEIKGGQLDAAVELIHHFVETGHVPSPDNNGMAHAVSKNDIAKNGDYNLSGERYKTGLVNNSNFEFVRLSEICDVRDGTHDSPKYVDTGYPLVTSKNIKDGFIDFINVNYISKEDFTKINQRSHVDDGDIIMPMIGTIGNPIVVKKEKEFAIKNVALIKFYKESKINNHYLKAILGSDYFADNYKNFSSGSTQKFISLSFIRNLQIPLPPLPIQEEIVAEIEGYQKIIDGAKAVVGNYKPNIDIDPDWEMVELGEALSFVSSGSTPKGGSEIYKVNGVLFIRSQNILNGYYDFSDCVYIPNEIHLEMSRSKVQYNDVFLNITGASIGRSAVMDLSIEANVNQHVALLRCKEMILPKFLSVFLNSKNGQQQIYGMQSGASREALNYSQIKQLKVPLPPIETQRQIVSQIEKEQALVNANKQLIEIFEQKIKDRIAKVWGNDKKEEKVYKENYALTLAAEEE